MTTSTESISSPRFDFFQTATQVIVSVYVKGCSQDDVQLDTDDHSLRLTINAPTKASLVIAPLFGPIDTSNSGVTTLPSKVEISLQKLQPGIQWPSLQGSDAGGSTTSTTVASTSTPNPTSRTRSKWDSFKDEEEEDGQNKTTGNETGKSTKDEASIDDFFKQLYANADDDTRKAMMKSYQESGGTALSTNWEEVKKGTVKSQPPKGMEARKW
ncbi:SGS-domain-containing protein [Meira miltonrushii]|uniref:SGS-domain-containing protein n=1 Tax=Meira miltonrushii TaxID=1280837 RepID=A0A316V457_9BASI|nr:SGS-domain-containing protein [Meira miltonrushii]PWN32339.1 SGS-domain-containing protein [Meira miltonrushii]